MAATEPAPDGTLPPGPLLRLISDRRVAYLIVGAFNTANAFFLFVVAQLVLGTSFRGYMASLLISHVLGVLCAFVLHRRFVFRVRGHVWLDLARFEVVNLAALGLNAVLLPFFVEVVGLPVIGAQIVAGGLAVIGTYFGHLLFSFRRKPHEKPGHDEPAPDPTTSEAVDS
jgi:putative flippase GtrA